MPRNAEAQPKQHFRILEFWRLAAALLVMIFHFVEYGTGAALVLGDLLHRLLPLMEMFFMISGFLIMLRYSDTLLAEPGSYRRFLVRRVARLYPLYLAHPAVLRRRRTGRAVRRRDQQRSGALRLRRAAGQHPARARLGVHRSF